MNTYEEKYWYMETLSLLHRFVFTGAIHLVFAETRVQIWIGVVLSLVVFVTFQLTLPYQASICSAVQSAAFLQLLLTYLSAFPLEREYVYPPLTYLRPTGRREIVSIARGEAGEGTPQRTVTILEVEPHVV